MGFCMEPTSGAAQARDGIDRLTRRAMGDGAFAGSVVRVERRGRLVFEGAWGDALEDGAAREEMTTSSVFDLASVSKLFTATAVLRLASAGRLELESAVADVLGYGSSGLGAALGGADIRDLLTHSSGIHYWYPFYTRRGEPFEAILADVLAEHPRRREVIYSDLNFMLLGKIVEKVAGLSLREAVRALVIEPLGLSRSGYVAPPSGVVATEFGNRIEERMVADLGLRFNGWRSQARPLRGEPDDGNCYYYFGGAAGHAGVFSDAASLAALGESFLVWPGKASDGFIRQDLLAEARRDHGGDRGLGFQVGENYPSGGFGHTGFTGTYLHVNDGSGLVIVCLTNRLHVAAPRRINDYYQDVSRLALAGDWNR